ncbi:transport protein SgaT [Klebsiella pneumoniae]|uniref:Ascorbate-specific PTS system EIIC component n=1 Tax=Klebsiella pneumoniae TaxID=573 RepID=A0A2X3GNX9_KLEPN|nr:transport protein SgaT [Klebsiella pneumoniae]
MLLLGGLGMALIIPGMVPHFFCGGTSGVFADKLGGKRGCIIASFIGGIFLAFLPAMLLPALGNLGFENSTFADFDFAVWGHHYRECVHPVWSDHYLSDLSGAARRAAGAFLLPSRPGGGQHAQL